MKTIKSILYSAVGVAMLGMSAGCTNLDEVAYSEVVDDGHEFSEMERTAMFYPVYNSLRDFVWGWFGFTDLADMASDLWCVPYRYRLGRPLCAHS